VPKKHFHTIVYQTLIQLFDLVKTTKIYLKQLFLPKCYSYQTLPLCFPKVPSVESQLGMSTDWTWIG